MLELEKAYADAKADPAFKAEMRLSSTHYIGRPSPLYFAERLTEHLGGAKIYFKREELNHTGAHKVNNVLGQILLARRMGKKRIIAETGAGQHGVATATLCARFGLECIVYMGAVDVERQKPNVFRMKMLGAKVVPVQSGTKTLKDAMNEALARLGHQRRRHLLLHRHRRRPASLSGHGARLPVRHRRRDARADDGGGRPPAGLASSPASAAAPTPSACSTPSSTTADVEIYGVEAAGHGLERLARRLAHRRPSRRAARQPHLPADERRRPDPGRPFDLGRPRLSPASARSIPGCTRWAA